MAEYRLTPRAQRDLDAIFDYTATHWDLPQAMRYTDLIEAACADLAEAPQQAQGCTRAAVDPIASDNRSIFLCLSRFPSRQVIPPASKSL